jgi:hypothetical protein
LERWKMDCRLWHPQIWSDCLKWIIKSACPCGRKSDRRSSILYQNADRQHRTASLVRRTQRFRCTAYPRQNWWKWWVFSKALSHIWHRSTKRNRLDLISKETPCPKEIRSYWTFVLKEIDRCVKTLFINLWCHNISVVQLQSKSLNALDEPGFVEWSWPLKIVWSLLSVYFKRGQWTDDRSDEFWRKIGLSIHTPVVRNFLMWIIKSSDGFIET